MQRLRRKRMLPGRCELRGNWVQSTAEFGIHLCGSAVAKMYRPQQHRIQRGAVVGQLAGGQQRCSRSW